MPLSSLENSNKLNILINKIMKRFKKIALKISSALFLFLMTFSVFVTIPQVKAATDLTGEAAGSIKGTLTDVATNAGFKKKDLVASIGSVINTVLALLGVILVVLIIYGGFLWMTAGGNEEQIKKAKKFLSNAIIGLVIVLAAYSITFFVVDKLITATMTP